MKKKVVNNLSEGSTQPRHRAVLGWPNGWKLFDKGIIDLIYLLYILQNLILAIWYTTKAASSTNSSWNIFHSNIRIYQTETTIYYLCINFPYHTIHINIEQPWWHTHPCRSPILTGNHSPTLCPTLTHILLFTWCSGKHVRLATESPD